MKKRFLCLVTLLAMLLHLSVPANAISVYSNHILPILSCSRTTATCVLKVKANTANDSIAATMKLYQGNTKLASYTASGTGSLSMKKTKKISSGKTYKLTVSVTIDGKTSPTISVTDTS